jgi:hypothetical protein
MGTIRVIGAKRNASTLRGSREKVLHYRYMILLEPGIDLDNALV